MIREKKNAIQKWKSISVGIICEIAGSFLFAIGTNNFAIAAQLPLAGFSGVAFILNRLFGLPVGWALICLNIPLLILCLHVLGKDFLVRSVRCLVISSLMLDYLAPLFPVYQGDQLLAAVAAGVITGFGFALIYTKNSSTGGLDFIIMAIKIWYPHFPLGKITMVLDFIIIAAESMVLQDVDGMIYGLITTFILSQVIDKVIFGINSGKLALIVTEYGDTVCKVISDTCNRGSTILPGLGGYNKAEKQVVVSVCSTKQMCELQKVVQQVDPAAFTIILESNEVHGSGFATVRFGD